MRGGRTLVEDEQSNTPASQCGLRVDRQCLSRTTPATRHPHTERFSTLQPRSPTQKGDSGYLVRVVAGDGLRPGMHVRGRAAPHRHSAEGSDDRPNEKNR
jgi:hypothetical protein